MDSFRRAAFNLRRLVALAALVALVLSVIGGLVIVAIRSADDAGTYAARAALVVGALVVLSAVLGVIGRPLPRRVVLEIDLSSAPAESHPDNPLAALTSSKSLTLREVVETIDRAAADDRVTALIGYIGLDQAGLATLQELRDAIARFRATGKRAVAFADTFGQLGGGNGGYYLATAFDEIVLQPSGEVGLVGLHHDVNFIRRALDKLGVDVTVEGRHEFKNAANQLVETGFTGPHREALERLMASQWEQIITGVAAARGLTPDAVQAAADRGPLFATAGLEAGLIDRVGFRDDAVARAKELGGDGAQLRWLPRYRKLAVKEARGKPTVAVITAVGAIQRTKVPVNPLSPGASIAGDHDAATIRKAVEDKKVQAILLRVSSPGGSAVASETMWREVVRAGEAGTPVIASMGDVAASGGYYMSMAAARIVAQPGTVTGSIGVVAMKPVLARAKEKIGFDVEAIGTGAHAGIMSLNRPFDESEHESFSGWLDHIYDDFITKVGAGRHLAKEDVHEVARGRVWTGADAQARSLVDELGGFDVALRHVREAAGLEPDAALRVVDYPKTSTLAKLRSSPGRSSEDPKGVLAAVAALVPIARALGLIAERGVLHADLEPEDWQIR